MICPDCGGKIRVVDTLHSPNNETYRRRKCTECDYAFYTIEYEVEETEMFLEDLHSCARYIQKRSIDAAWYAKQKTIRELRGRARSVICRKCNDDFCEGMDECPKVQRYINSQMKRRNKNV